MGDALTLELDPKDAIAHADRGLAKDALGDLNGALADYNRALELNAALFQAYMYRGYLNGKTGNHIDPKADFSRAAALNPKAQKSIEAKGYLMDGTKRLPAFERFSATALRLAFRYGGGAESSSGATASWKPFPALIFRRED